MMLLYIIERTCASGGGVPKVAKWRCMRSMMKKEPAVGFIAATSCVLSRRFMRSVFRS